MDDKYFIVSYSSIYSYRQLIYANVTYTFTNTTTLSDIYIAVSVTPEHLEILMQLSTGWGYLDNCRLL